MSHQQNKTKQKHETPLKLVFSNIRLIPTNLCHVESFLFEDSADVLAICESNCNSLYHASLFSILVYHLSLGSSIVSVALYEKLCSGISPNGQGSLS